MSTIACCSWLPVVTSPLSDVVVAIISDHLQGGVKSWNISISLKRSVSAFTHYCAGGSLKKKNPPQQCFWKRVLSVCAVSVKTSTLGKRKVELYKYLCSFKETCIRLNGPLDSFSPNSWAFGRFFPGRGLKNKKSPTQLNCSSGRGSNQCRQKPVMISSRRSSSCGSGTAWCTQACNRLCIPLLFSTSLSCSLSKPLLLSSQFGGRWQPLGPIYHFKVPVCHGVNHVTL